MNTRKLLTTVSTYLLVEAVLAFMVLSSLAETPKRGQLTPLVEGATAYIRVKSFTAKPLERATPEGAEATLNYGQTVRLIQQKNVPPTMWLVSTEKAQSWVPAFILTVNKAEIDFLKKTNRIPTSISFVFGERVRGRVAFGGRDRSSEFAFEANAVLHDDEAVRLAGKNPVFFSKTKTYKLESTRLYFCVSVDESGRGTFDCIDLTTLSFCKE